MHLRVVFLEKAAGLKSVKLLSVLQGLERKCVRAHVLVAFIYLRIYVQISFFGGLILNEGVNWLLKHILREPRPCAGE